jgi:hypothetical protein
VKDLDQRKVGRPFTAAVVESALGAYPGMFPTAPPGEGSAFGVYWPTLVDRDRVAVQVAVDGAVVELSEPSGGRASASWHGSGGAGAAAAGVLAAPKPGAPRPPEPGSPGPGTSGPKPGPMTRAWAPEPGTLLGAVVGARSGDKGGNANVGVWIPEPGVGPSRGLDEAGVAARYAWLAGWLTPERVRALLPEAADLPVDVHPLPNLRAVNVVIRGLLGRGVADSTSLDPQAKGLGEHLRARRVH